jgi:hypothetical protein
MNYFCLTSGETVYTCLSASESIDLKSRVGGTIALQFSTSADAQISVESARNAARYVVDDAGNARKIGADIHARIRTAGAEFRHSSRLVVFGTPQDFFSVVVHSYLDVSVDDSAAEEMAVDYLEELSMWVPETIAIL